MLSLSAVAVTLVGVDGAMRRRAVVSSDHALSPAWLWVFTAMW